MGIGQEIINRIAELKEELKKKVKGLPDNPKINRISDRCFTVNVKDLSSDLILAPEYYDFKKQYIEIIDVIERANIHNIDSIFRRIISTGFLEQSHSNRCRLNPVVIKYLKELFT